MSINYVTKPIPGNKPEVTTVLRPWGSFNQYAHNKECTVSLMTVLPDQRLSLQAHTGRAELWIIIDNGAIVQTGDEIKEYKAGDEVWIRPNQPHRLSAAGSKPVRVLEVAFGNWQQDDIVRFSDDYKRG